MRRREPKDGWTDGWTYRQTDEVTNRWVNSPEGLETRPGNLVDATPPIQALGGKGVLLSYQVMKVMLGQPIGHGKKRILSIASSA